MSRPRIPAHVLADRGVEIELLDGKSVTICYGFRSLMQLEDQYGSVNAAIELVQQGVDGKAFTSLAGILAAGLMHETTETGVLGDANVLADYLDPTKLEDYAEAMSEAFTRSFPSSDDDDESESDESDPTVTTSSPGASGTSSHESASASVTTNSGA